MANLTIIFALVIGIFSRACFALPLVDVNNMEGITGAVLKKDQFTTLVDLNQTRFSLRRIITNSTTLTQSCYEMKQNAETTRFCYPSINVAGIAMCGTSTIYEMLAKHDAHILPAHKNKDYCPKGSLYEYFKGFSSLYSLDQRERRVHINGCSDTQLVAKIHAILAPRAAVYIIAVRNPAERTWAAYNTWCTTSPSAVCPEGYMDPIFPWYRDPIMFDQLLRAANYPLFKKSQLSCGTLNTVYQQQISAIDKVSKILPLVVAIDAFSSDSAAVKKTHLDRIQTYINTNLTEDRRHASAESQLRSAGGARPLRH